MWLDAELGEAAPHRKQWLELLGLVPIEDVEALARALCRRPELAPAGPQAWTAAELARLMAALRAILKKPVAPKTDKIRERAEAALDRLEGLAASLVKPLALPDSPAVLDRLGDLKWPEAWEEDVAAQAAYLEALDLVNAASALSESQTRKASDRLRPFVERFLRQYDRLGLISFDGLLYKTLRLVRGDKEVRRRLQGAFDAILVDEFQDTDPMQGELLLYLAEKPGAAGADDWRRTRLEPGKLFIVGDPKQSIYRFRGADMRAYSGFTEHVLREHAELCVLSTSFRSPKELVDAVNSVFGTVMTEVPGLQSRYRDIHPPGEKTGGALELVLTGDAQDPALAYKAEASRDFEAVWIADWIARHCRKGKFKDVALLLRTTTSLAGYIAALKDAGIPYVVESDRYFYGTQEVLDLVNLLRVLDDPGDGRALTGLLRSPLAGLADREILALRARGEVSYLAELPAVPGVSAHSRSRLARFFKTLRGLRERAGREPLGDFVARVLNETFLLEVCAAAYHHEQTVANLLKFARLAAEAGEERAATLKEFIGEIQRAVGEGAQEGESPLADEGLDAVRILTIHKAKGLEFPIVILPYLDTAPRGGGGDGAAAQSDWGTGAVGLRLPKAWSAAAALLESEARRRDGYEAVRLLYVAMTRAKEKLILLGRADPGSAHSFSAILRGSDEARHHFWPGKGERPAALDLGHGLIVPIRYVNARSLRGTTLAKVEKEAKAHAPKMSPDAFGALWKERAAACAETGKQTLFTTPTALSREPEDRVEDDGLDPERAASLGSRAEAILIGELCHRVLEGWDFKAGKGSGLEKALASAHTALARSHPGAQWELVLRESAKILGPFLKSPLAKELAEADIIGRELPFLCPAGNQVLRGTMDLLCRQEGRLIIADYKTGAPGSAKDKSSLARYKTQGRAYVQAVKKATGETAEFRLVFLRDASVLVLD